MPHYKFDQIAYNIRDKKMPEPGDEKTYIGLEHLDSGSLKVTRWGNEVELKGQKLVMKKGDLLFGRRNTYLRRAAIAPHDGIFSAHGMIFRPKTEVIDPEYFPFFISSNYFMDAAIRISVGSLSPTVNWKTLKELEFDIPTLEEQKKNAELLKAINDTKEAYQELLLKTDDLVKSQFIEMFANEEKTEDLDSCAYIKKGKTITRAAVVEGDIPVVAAGIEPSCYHNQSNRDAGIITISASGANAGYVNYWDVPIFASDCNTVLTKNAERLDNVFLFWRLRVMQEEIFGMKHGSGQPHVYAKDLKKIKVPIPSIDRQRQFTYMVEQSEKSKFELQQAIESTDNLIKSILYSNLEEKKE